MPMFDYKCVDCRKEFAELVNKNTVVKCPNCKSLNVKKFLISKEPAYPIFKGSGFYKTDYRNKK